MCRIRLTSTLAGMLTYILGLASPMVADPTPAPLGDETQINAYTIERQLLPQVAAGPQGEMVVVWNSYGSFGSDADGFSVQARRFAPDGTLLGDEVQVNTLTTSDQIRPAVSIATDGGFAVSWVSGDEIMDPDHFNFPIRARLFANDGTPLGNDFTLSTDTELFSFYTDITATTNGDFMVVWDQTSPTSSAGESFEIRGRRLSGAGVPLGNELQINTYTTSSQVFPKVEPMPDGELVVTWVSEGSSGTDADLSSVQARRLGDDGMPLDGEFQVNTLTTAYQSSSAVATTPNGEMVVTWFSSVSGGTDNDATSIQARLFGDDGMPLGNELQVNAYTTSFQSASAVASTPNGELVVVWQSFGSTGSDSDALSIQGQRLAADGTPLGSEFQINTYTSGLQQYPSVAMAANRRFLVAWQSNGSAGSDDDLSSIQGQWFELPDLFADGFESGDITAWSTAAGS